MFNMYEGYDYSYFFIVLFIEEYLEFYVGYMGLI